MSDTADDRDDKVTLTLSAAQTAEFPVCAPSTAATASTSRRFTQADRPDHARPRLREHRVDAKRDHLHRRRRRHPALPRLRDRAPRQELHLPRGRLAAHLRRAARRRPSWTSSTRRSAGTRCCTRTSSASSPRCRTTRTRCRCCRRPCRRCRPTTRTRSTRTTPRRSSSPPSACSRSCRSSPPTRTRSALGQAFLYPDNSLSFVENFLKLNFGNLAELYEVNPVLVEGARPAADPARGPRAERLDVDRAPGRLDRGQPVRLRLRRHQRPVRPAARRRQRGRAHDARADPRLRRERAALRRAREEQGGRRPAHGLRPPGLQELRPARAGS